MTEERKKELRDNYLRVAERIDKAVSKRGGDRPVRLLAASKTYPAEDIIYLIGNCGLELCGENHAQEFVEKYDAVSNLNCRMDFIGHLQTHKVKYIAGKAGLIHSLDSVKLASEIQKYCEKHDLFQNVLVEINIGDEETKTGISKEYLPEFLDELAAFDRIRVAGMMSMAPKSDKIDEIRKYFRESYSIFLDNFTKKRHNTIEPVLSMGMSDSFEIAIEEGADIVRVGSLIFGNRNYNK